MSKQDGFREKANEVVAQLDSEDLLCAQDDCPKCGSNVAILAAALRAAHNEAVEECAKAAEDYWKQGKNVYARQAGRAVESRVRSLKSPEGGGV